MTIYRTASNVQDIPDTSHSGLKVTGGAVRLQLNSEGNEHIPTEEYRSPQVRMGNGVSSIQMNHDGTIHRNVNQGVIKYNSADMLNTEGRSVSATARTPGALSRATGDIKDDTLVTVGGQTMSAEIASSLGFLRKVGDNYFDVNAPTPSQSSTLDTPEVKQVDSQSDNASGDTEEDSKVMLSEDTEGMIENYYQTGGNDAAEKLLNAVIMESGELSPDSLVQLAPMFGKSPEQLKGELAVIADGFQKQAAYTVQRMDNEVDPIEVFKYALETYDRDKLQDIQRRHFAGDLSGYKDLVDHYNANQVSEQRFIRLYGKGWQFYRKGNDFYWYHPDHGEIESKSALKSGVLK